MVAKLEAKVHELDTKMNRQLFRFSSIKDDDVKVAFYTGFPIRLHVLKHSFSFLN